MSIYATTVAFEADDHDDCDRWVRCGCDQPHGHARGMYGDGWHAYYDARRACTCRAGPIAYQGSHVLPADDDLRDGCFDLGVIPGFIERDDRPPLSGDREDWPYHPWLRVSVNGETTILTKEQVTEVRDELTRWLEHT